MDDGKTRDFLGLPTWKPLYGFGDTVTLRAKMTNALFFHGVDRRALTGALPRHPRVRLHRASPILVVQSDFLHCADNGDPDGNDYPYREIMIACLLEATSGVVGPMWPLALFLDSPIATAAGREFHGFPKVPAAVTIGDASAAVDYTSWPGGKPKVSRVMSARWHAAGGIVARALHAAAGAIKGALHAAGIADLADGAEQLALAPLGEVWNLHQQPDLANPRRATFSQITRFKPSIAEPAGFRLLERFALDLPGVDEESIWQLGRRFFDAKDGRAVERKAAVAFAWEATMRVSGGEVIDTWR